MENPDIDRPAVHIGFPFFAALFVASFFGAPFAAVSAVLLFAAVFLLFLFKQHRQRPNFVLSLIAAAAAFAVFAVAMNLFVLPTERYDGGTYTVTGNVESFLTKSNGRFYYKLHVTHIDEPVQDVDFSVRLSHSEDFPAEIGDTVTCEAKFFAFEDSLGLSPRTSWLADNTVLSAYVTDYESVQVTPAEKRPFSYYVNQIRTHFHNLILENYPKTESSVLSAMLLGLRDDMETELTSAYKKAGASHILAISGMHMAILTQFTLGFLGLLGLKRRPAALVSAVFTLLFMFVSGLSASVVRSGIMQLILLFGILLGRQAEPLNSLAVAVLTMSLVNPFCAGDVSFRRRSASSCLRRASQKPSRKIFASRSGKRTLQSFFPHFPSRFRRCFSLRRCSFIYTARCSSFRCSRRFWRWKFPRGCCGSDLSPPCCSPSPSSPRAPRRSCF